MRLTRRSVGLLLAVHFAVAWTAVVLRIDRFPLTWAPMYAVYKPKEPSAEIRKLHKGKQVLEEKGWRVEHRDGSASDLPRRAVNVPRRSMWRLYYERTFSRGPPKYKHLNHDAGTIDRWLWGLAPGEKFEDPDWKRRLLVSVNKTLGHEPDDPDFIVRMRAKAERFVFDAETYEQIGTEKKKTSARWKEEWREDFE